MVESDDRSRDYKALSHLISLLKNISEEELREVVAERVESMSVVDHTESETSPEKSQTVNCFEVGEPSSKPLSAVDFESDTDDYAEVHEYLRRVNAEEDEKEDYYKVVRDGVSRNKSTSHGHRVSSSRKRARERYRSNTTCEEPAALVKSCDPDPEYSPSSCVRGSCKKRKAVVAARSEEVEPIQMIPPKWLLDVMSREENNCYDPKLIAMRKLFPSDLDAGQRRLSVPLRQVINPDFLTEEETSIIDEFVAKTRSTGVSVEFVDPKKNKRTLDLRKWAMGENWYYMFVGGWDKVVDANEFKNYDVFHLWSFRSGSGKLCFALFPPTGCDDAASTSGGSAQVPSPIPPSPSARDSSFSSQGCSGKRSSRSS